MDNRSSTREKTSFNVPLPLNLFFLGSIFFLLLFFAFYLARELFVPIVIALLFNFLLTPSVKLLKKIYIPAQIGSAIVILLLLFIIGMFGYGLSRPATHWLTQEPEAISIVDKKLTTWAESFSTNFPNLSKISDNLTQKQSITNQTIVSNKTSFLIGTATFTWYFFAEFATTIILLYFFLIYEDYVVKRIIYYMGKRRKEDVSAVSNEIQNQIFKYLFARTIINVFLGVVVTIIMFVVSMPDPVLWGVMVGLLSYIPYLGGLISLIVITTVALFSFVSVGYAFLITFLVFILLVIEANIIAPIVFGKTLTLNPIVIFLSLMFFTFIWGIAGAFVAVPMIVAIKIISEAIFQNI